MPTNGVYNVVTDGGADPTGVTDATSAINTTAASAAEARGVIFFPPGTYLISRTVTITSDCEGWGATLSFTGSGLALQVGSSSSGVVLARTALRLPRVVFARKPGTGWTAGTIGIEVYNANACEIVVPYVTGFETGVLMYGSGTGFVYNVATLFDIRNNKVNVKLDADSRGWCNQNLFLGGRLSHQPEEGTLVAGTRQIFVAHTTNPINNNTFINTSLESSEVAEFMLDVDGGNENVFENCRWEDSSGHGRVRWGQWAQENTIRDGSYTHVLTQTKVAGQVRNQIESVDLTEQQGSNATALRRWENLSSSSYPVLEVYRAGTMSSSYTPGTDYTVSLSADALKVKWDTDTQERVRVEASTGRVYLGPGGATAAVAYLVGAAEKLQLGGVHLCMVTDGSFDIGQSSSGRPRNVYATGKVTLGSTQIITGTGTPEAAVTAPVGSLFLRTNGGAGTTLYVKESGAGNTGWVAK